MKPYRPIMDIVRIVPPELQRVSVIGPFVASVEELYKPWFVTSHLACHAGDPLDLRWRVDDHAVRTAARARPGRGASSRRVTSSAGQSVFQLYLFPRCWVSVTCECGCSPAVLTLTGLCALLGVDSTDAPNTPTLMVTTTVFFIFLAPVLQFSVRSTGFVLLLTVPLTVVVAIVSADRDGTWNGTLNYQLWLLTSTSLIVLGISLAIENSSRGRFVDERVIARQQEELLNSRALIRRYAPPAVADRIEHGDTTVDSPQRAASRCALPMSSGSPPWRIGSIRKPWPRSSTSTSVQLLRSSSAMVARSTSLR